MHKTASSLAYLQVTKIHNNKSRMKCIRIKNKIHNNKNVAKGSVYGVILAVPGSAAIAKLLYIHKCTKVI